MSTATGERPPKPGIPYCCMRRDTREVGDAGEVRDARQVGDTCKIGDAGQVRSGRHHVVEADGVRAKDRTKLCDQRHEVDARDRLGLVRERHFVQRQNGGLAEWLEIRAEQGGDADSDAGVQRAERSPPARRRDRGRTR